MATEVRSIATPPTLLGRRSGSRLQPPSNHPTPRLADTSAQNKDHVTRRARGSFTLPFTLTPLTPILASPIPSLAITPSTPSTSSVNPNPAGVPSNSTQNSHEGVKHKRSRSTLSRLHVPSPEDHSNSRTHVRSATVPTISVSSLGPGQLSGTPPSPYLLKDIIILNGIPITKTPSPTSDTAHRGVDFPTVPPLASVTPRPRTKSARIPFTLGSDDEGDTSRQQQKREAAAKAKKFERYDDLRRYHALMELLKTEAKYLQDLRLLINVYLQQLQYAVTSRSVASYFGTSTSSSKQTPPPPPSAFTSIPTHGQPTTPPLSPSTLRRRSVGPIDRAEIEKELSLTRPMFTEEDTQLLRRNSNELLAFHERFVGELKEALAPLGSKFRFDTEDEHAYVDMPRHDTLELAIQIIVSMFVDRAQSFELYQSFCSTHPEAVELVQRARRASPADWEAWEKRCSNYVLDNHRCDSLPVPSTGAAVQFGLDSGPSPNPQGASVARSLTARSKRPHSFMASKPSRANTAPPHLLIRHDHHAHGQTPRLEFLDHLIKPVQRICKYHLLLDQLKSRVPSHPHPTAGTDATFDHAELLTAGQTESLVSHACEAMRTVVNSVNDDRRKHEDRWKTLLIASRAVPPPATSSSSPSHPQMTPEFLMTLGNCSMSGALDVIYHRPTTSTMTKAKYLGAFLYEQGYLVLVRVGKGKAYEPQHWFPLRDFDVLDLNDEDGTLPYSFHLTGCGHHFQFAAACLKEKDVWKEGLRKAIIAAAGSDPAELPSSLLDENREEVAPAPSVTIHDAPVEGLPTIESETEHIQDLLASRPGIAKALSDPKVLSDDSHPIRTDPRSHSQPVSRRASSNSVRAIFSPFLFDQGVRLVRPTTIQRQHTDQGLSDVFSDSCRDARNLAELQNQELFQLPGSIIRSKSGIAVSGLKGRKDSKIFNRRSYAGPPAPPSSPTNPTPPSTEKKVRHKKERPSSVAVFTQSRIGENSTPHSTPALWALNPTIMCTEGDRLVSPDVTVSQCSSKTASNVESAHSSPAGLRASPVGSSFVHLDTVTIPFESGSGIDKDYGPKRSKSMVDSVKSFFSSPSKRLPGHLSMGADLLADSPSLSRVRSRSSPMPCLRNPLTPSLPSVTVHHVDAAATAPNISSLPLPDRGKDAAGALGRKRSLFGYGRLHGTDVSRLSAVSTVSATSSATETSGFSSPVRRRSVKDILLYFRNS